MTIQDSEYFFYNNIKYFSEDQPLKKLLKERNLVLHSFSSANWRGYVATWEVCGPHLYIINFNRPYLRKDNDLNFLFPEADSRVLADWFSGTVDAFDEPRPIAFWKYGQDHLPNDWLRLYVRKGLVMKANLRKVRNGTEKDRRLFKHRPIKFKID